ncbi:TNF receptor-associated factor 3-like [Sycon ciliatum]|uniref:TNF receptor-associated factor 3-like n=1 Tax=Sycon ciliatum TaxID=27933 RepID=UPI0031F62D77
MVEPSNILVSYAGVHCLQTGTESLTCCKCNNLLRFAVQSSCGCRHCKRCFADAIEEYRKSGRRVEETGELICSVCTGPIDPDESFEDLFARKEVNELRIACAGESLGCQWIGKVVDYESHYQVCQYVSVPCSESRCDAMVPRNQLSHHRSTACAGRMVACQFCNASMRYRELDEHLKEKCTKITLTCPNTCGAMDFTRDEIVDHRKTCPMEQVHCYYSGAGCTYYGPRNTLPVHHDNNGAYHMQLVYLNGETVKQTCAKLTSENTKLRKENKDLNDKVVMLTEQQAQMQKKYEAVEWMVEMLSKKFSAIEGSSSSSSLALAGSKSLSPVNEAPAGLHQYAAARTSQHLPVSFPTEQLALTTSSIADSSGVATSTKDSVVSRFDHSKHSSELEHLKYTTNSIMDHLQRVDNSIAMQNVQLADMMIRQDLIEVKGCEGILVWRISNVARRLQEAVSGRTPSLYSPPFHSSQSGYRMCARVYLNGDGSGKNTHVSLFFVIMRSEFDSLLPWPFQQKVKLSLLDQTPFLSAGEKQDLVEVFRPDIRSSSFQRPTTEMNIATGCPKLAPKSYLASDRYVRDDTLFIKIEVSQRGINPPDKPMLDSTTA